MSALQELIARLPSIQSCLPCLTGSSHLQMNGRSLKIVRLLGEGGFSYVYLVEDVSNGSLYALKKIRCAFGQESVNKALEEARAYAFFRDCPNVIHSIDHFIVQDHADSGVRTLYILLPFYQRGDLQDIINSKLVSNVQLSDDLFLAYMIGTAKALVFMHNVHENSSPSLEAPPAGQANDEDGQPVSELENASSEAPGAIGMEAEPLINAHPSMQRTGNQAFSHRDIKPGNVMIADNGVDCVLMDLGSLAKSPIYVETRAMALTLVDQAAEHSTMSYRAPELFDVKTGMTIDSKSDVWSFGCLMFACLVGKSPFEMRSEETGGSLSLAILGGDWRFPDETVTMKPGPAVAPPISIAPEIKTIIRMCLAIEPGDRPDMAKVLRLLSNLQGSNFQASRS